VKVRKIYIWSAAIVAILAIVILLLFVLRLPKVVLPEISIAAEPVLTIGGFTITNTLLATWVTMIVLILVSWLTTRRLKMVPGRWQSAFEALLEGFYGLVQGVAGPKWARRFYPIVMSIFLFLLVSNLLGLTPLYGGWGVLHHTEEEGFGVKWLNESHTIGLWQPMRGPVEPSSGEPARASEGEQAGQVEGGYVLSPMLRSAATDLNTTLALALVSVVLTQYFGLKARGLGYLTKFIDLRGVARAFTKPGLGCMGRIGAFFMGLIDVFVGLLEIISEFSKVISFSFRLFGNIFAGEVLLAVMGFLIPYLISLPFYGLEIFVGVVQALVFMMLTVAFFVLAISGHGAEEAH
jgi:F-type H+-transporting ATPase subunit a